MKTECRIKFEEWAKPALGADLEFDHIMYGYASSEGYEKLALAALATLGITVADDSQQKEG